LTKWQDVKEEASNKLDRFNFHELLCVVIGDPETMRGYARKTGSS
jgi:hypothetical protein